MWLHTVTDSFLPFPYYGCGEGVGYFTKDRRNRGHLSTRDNGCGPPFSYDACGEGVGYFTKDRRNSGHLATHLNGLLTSVSIGIFALRHSTCRDFEKIGERMLNPVVEALRPIAEINIESQVLYHTPKSSYSYFDDKLGGNVLSTGDIPFFVNSNEWHLDTSISATGQSKVLQFVVYIPSARECPLYLQLPDGGLSKTNAFISPMWGGDNIWNPLDCSLGSKKTHGTRKKMSSQGITIPAMTSLFYSMLGDYMSSKAKVPVTKEDLTAQFQHFRRLWGYYQKDMQSVTLGCSMESKNLKNKDAMMRNLKKELDLNKYKYILKYEDQFNYIFPSCHYQKSTPIHAFMYNTGSSGDMSVTSNRKRSIDEPFSRQLRQKSSDVDKPESSQNGMTLDIALDELSSVASVLTYGIATKCLQDPIKLRAYSRLPTIEKKVEFLHVAWRLEYDPASALASLPPPS